MIRLLVALALLPACSVKQAELRALESPNDAEAWEKLGNAYRLRMQRQRAADAYREAMRIDPGRAHLSQRLPALNQQEVRELRRQAMASPNDDEIWGDLGDLLRFQGDLLGSRQAYLRAFRIDPSDSEWHSALLEVGAGDVMLEYAQSSLDDTNDESLGDVGDLLAALGRTEEACDHYRRAAEIDPADNEWINHAADCGFDVPDALEGEATLFTEHGEGHEEVDLHTLEEQRNGDVALLARLGMAYHRSGDAVKAEETLWSALLLAPHNEELQHSYLVASGSTLRRTLEALRKAHPDDDELVGTLADHYLTLGLRQRARDAYRAAHELDEDDPEWTSKLALFD